MELFHVKQLLGYCGSVERVAGGLSIPDADGEAARGSKAEFDVPEGQCWEFEAVHRLGFPPVPVPVPARASVPVPVAVPAPASVPVPVAAARLGLRLLLAGGCAPGSL